MTITEFLEARITEDELVARDATPGPWYLDDKEQTVRAQEYAGEIVFDRSAEHSSEWVKNFKPTAEFIVRNEPARVLAECAAKRALSKLHSPGDYRGQLTCNDCGDWWDGSPVDFPCNTIKIVASVYKDHPDYRQEWAPDAV